jgi:lipopolysaccharide export system permease protein
VPWFFDLVGRVAALIAAVFAVTWLQRHNEMTALMAAGISRWRIIKPLVLGFVLVSLIAVVNREVMIPALRDQLTRQVRDQDPSEAVPVSPHFDHMTDILITGQDAIEARNQINQPVFRLPTSMSHFGHQVVAAQAIRRPATTDHPAGYLLSEVVVPENIDTADAVLLEGRPVIYTPAQTPWLQSGQCFVVSHVAFGQLAGGRAWRQFASTADLIRGLANPSMSLGADVRVAVHARIVQPVLDITLLFLGIPVVLARESRNVFVAAGSCVLIVAAFYVIVLAAHSLGMHFLLSPSQAAWLPLMILVPWAVATSAPLRR